MRTADGIPGHVEPPDREPDPQALPFVGRAAERVTLEHCLRRASSGHRAIVLIEGQAGIGKSRLLDLVLAEASRLDFRLCRVTVEEFGSNRPFGAILDALGEVRLADPQLASLAFALVDGDTDGSTLAPERAPTLSNAMIEGLLGCVRRLAGERPLVLAFDDAHWSDASSLFALQALARGLRDIPLALLVAFRPLLPGSRRDRLLRGLRRHGAVQMHLGPLDDESLNVLGTAAAGRPLGAGGAAVLKASEGNPLVAIEVARGLAANSGTDDEGCQRASPHVRLLGSTYLCRQAALPDETIELLTFSAVLGSPFDVYQLSHVTGRAIVDLLGPLEEAVRWGLLKEAGVQLAFRHEVVRQALYGRLPVALRRALHLHAAWRLAELGASALTVSAHLARGAPPGDARALTWLIDTAREAIHRAPREAVELLERALLLADPAGTSREMLAVELCAALRLTGRFRAATELARRELLVPRAPAVEGRLREELVFALFDGGNVADARREAGAALQNLDELAPVAPSLMAAAASGHVLTGELRAARSLACRAESAAERADDEFARCLAEQVLCVAASLDGWTDDALTRARRLAEQPRRDARSRVYLVNTPLALALVDADRMDEAEQVLLGGMEMATTVGIPGNRLQYQLALARLHYLSGNWSGAVDEAQAVLGLADELNIDRGVVLAHSVLAFISLSRNDLAGAEAHLLAGESFLESKSPELGSWWIHWARAYFEEARGRDEEALAALERAWQLASQLGARSEYPLWGPDLVRLLVRAGEAREARSRAGDIELVAGRMSVPWAKGAGLRARGYAEADAVKLLEAVRAERDSRRPWQRARGAESVAVILAGGAGTEDRTRLLEQALRLYETLEAIRDAARCRAALRRLGVRRKPSGAVAAKRFTTRGWEALTASELQVVRLIGQGLSYREAAGHLFISPRTVETHVSHAMTKLECSSRSELRAELARRQS